MSNQLLLEGVHFELSLDEAVPALTPESMRRVQSDFNHNQVNREMTQLVDVEAGVEPTRRDLSDRQSMNQLLAKRVAKERELNRLLYRAHGQLCTCMVTKDLIDTDEMLHRVRSETVLVNGYVALLMDARSVLEAADVDALLESDHVNRFRTSCRQTSDDITRAQLPRSP